MPRAKDNPKEIAYRKAYQKKYAQLPREKERKRKYMESYVLSKEQRNRQRAWQKERSRDVRRKQRSEYYQSEKHQWAVMKTLWHRARKNAKDVGVPFNLDIEDLRIPPECPILHIPLIVRPGSRNANTPSIDRVIPRLGYVKGNVQMISWRANRIKCDASFEEMIAMGEWAKTQRLKEALNG